MTDLKEIRDLFARGALDEAEAALDARAPEPDDAEAAVALTLAGCIHFRRRRLDRACETLARAVEHDPENGGAQYALGRALIASGQLDEAVYPMTQAAHYLRDSFAPVWRTASLLSITNRMEMARARIDRALALRPDSDFVQGVRDLMHGSEALPARGVHTLRNVLRVRVLVERGALDEAAAQFDAMPAEDRTYPAGLACLGYIQFRRRQMRAAADTLERSVAGDYRNGWAQYMLGRALIATGRSEQAVQPMTRAAQYHPDSPAVAYRAARLLLSTGRTGPAHELLEGILQRAPDNAVLRFLDAMCAFREGRHDAAERALGDLVTDRPDYAVAAAYHGLSTAYLGNVEQGYAEAAAAIEAGANDDEIVIRCTFLAHQMGRQADVAALVQRALENDRTGWVHFLAAMLEEERGNLEAAIALVEAAAEHVSDLQFQFRPPIQTRGPLPQSIAQFLLRVNRPDQAYAFLTRLRDQQALDAETEAALATTCSETERWDELAALLDAVAEKRDLTPQQAFQRAMAAFNTGDYETAEQQFRRYVFMHEREENLEGNYWLARTRMMLGDYDGAGAPLIAAERVDPAYRDLSDMVERCERALGRRLDKNVPISAMHYAMGEFPPSYRLRWTADEPLPLGSFWKGLLAELRVTGALIHREIVTRFSRSALGYAWAILQPLAYVVTLYLIYLGIERPMPHGISTVSFLVTGIVPVITFYLNTFQRTSVGISANRQLLYYRQVTTYNILFARTILEYLTGIAVFAVLLTGLYFLEGKVQIENPLLVLVASFELTLLGAITGTIVGSLTIIYPWVQQVGIIITRGLFFLSGAFYYASELPPRLRDVLLINPMFHLVELIRDGFYKTYTAHYADPGYVYWWLIGGTAVAILIEHQSRRHIEF